MIRTITIKAIFDLDTVKGFAITPKERVKAMVEEEFESYFAEDEGFKNIVVEVEDGLNADKWIPCEERLPSDTEIHEVTAKFIDGRLYTEFAYYDESREEWWKIDDDGIVNVVAWKEGSEPYKKEGADDE